MNAQDIMQQAEREIAEEEFRRAVEVEKDRLRKTMGMPWWKRLLSFAIFWRK